MSEGQQQRSQARRRYTFLAVLSPLAILLVWSLLTYREAVPAVILPSPLAVAASLWDMILNGYSGVSIWTHIGYSLMRVGIAFVLGSVLGIVIGLLRGRAEVVDALFVVPSEILRPIPPLGLIPLFILWFGIGETSKIALVALGVTIPLYLNLVAALRGIDRELYEVAATVKLSRAERVRHILIPGAMPGALVGFRQSLGVAWLALVVAEQVNAGSGLGFLINNARDFLQTDVIVVGLLAYAVLGLITDALVRRLEKRTLAWRGDDE
jgi:sulfonate transport system permease protein